MKTVGKYVLVLNTLLKYGISIFGNILQPVLGPIPYIGKGIRFDDENQEKTYLLVYYIAQYLYNNRYQIRQMKDLNVQNITKKYRKHHKINEIEQFYGNECKRVIYENQKLLKQK